MPSGEPTVKELAWTVAAGLLEANHFVTIEDQRSREIFRYDDGVYVSDGEAYIKQRIQENFEVKEDVSTHLVNEVTGHVERSTINPRSVFDETNPHLVLQNGLLNLHSLELEPFAPDHYALNKLPVTFDPSKGCPGSCLSEVHHRHTTATRHPRSPRRARGNSEEEVPNEEVLDLPWRHGHRKDHTDQRLCGAPRSG